ncbi:sulfide dehydrogenase (flavoprotein) subunit SudB [Desulfonauticus submarinus]|uniref:Sulfide dehydrogenase (Flavoprotein) subunit SudB n=1 Tax=Desulfonauticus submarinus TaxID=206665 RepID=A0A1H0C1F9_9BACT|nr:sulfide/dihydroorotate dehydrogenase-like FAD/NAD-binding protein [Desulfonauticus submarinus]SDN51728.1 sulfide dehydrogenase (flavoprotein) subunit SudB [Desulfonauticus submarinus]
MGFKIVKKRELIPNRVSELTIYAPDIASKARPGNFVILRIFPKGERIPLTIADKSPAEGTITIVYLVVGKTTAHLETFQVGDEILDVCGPLGKPTRIEKKGEVVCVGGGTGIAAMHHIAKGHAQVGNKVISVIGARSKDLLLFEEELSKFSHKVLVATDDGSKGKKGLVTQVLEDYLKSHEVKEVVAVGPVPMMKAVSELTKKYSVPTTVSLNSIMVDGIGMCGACRVSVGGRIRFACVEGPEFDAHEVDFDELMLRLRSYVKQEQISYNHFCECHGKEKN